MNSPSQTVAPAPTPLRYFATQTIKAFNTNKTSWIGLLVFVIVVVLALAAPVIAPFDPNDQNIMEKLRPPSAEHWLGTDSFGRDTLSRILYGARISLTIGLLGIAISFTLGLVFGGIAGYFGGLADTIIQRLIEIIRSFPELPLWMALSAVLPVTWSPILIYFGITGILALLDWTGLARAVRSKLLALREEDYCTAARLMGASPKRIIGRHLLPGFMSHLIAAASLSIPSMILGETALSFLGIGLRPPITSWGVLLNEAQNINVVALYPWLMAPVLPVIVVILAFNFFGDGLRDAADPYR